MLFNSAIFILGFLPACLLAARLASARPGGAFAVLLAFLAFPALKSSPRHRIPALTWPVALIAAATASYLWWDYAGVADRTGRPNGMDLAMA
ncbi:MAG: hypothetical protein AAFV49_24090, partial [Pseudomonadota bacterium]